MKKLTLLKTLLIMAAMLVGSMGAWGGTVKETYDFKTKITAGFSSANTSPSQSVTYYLYGNTETTTETNCARLNYLYNASGDQYSIGTHIYLFAHASNADLSNTNYWWIRKENYNVLYNNKTTQNQRFSLVGLSKGDKFTITFATGSLAFQTANVYLESDGTKTNVTASSTVDDCTSVESGKTYVVSDDALGEDGSINVAMVTKKATVSISKIVIERPSVTETIDAPTFNVAYNGANRTVTIIDGVTNSLNSGTTTYYTTDGSDPTTSSSVYSAPINITENCTVKAISVAVNGTVSSVGSQEVTVGKLTVASPTITFTSMVANGTYYSPKYTIANGDNSGILGTPTPTLSATFNGEAVDITSGYYVPSTAGTLIVTAAADNYTSASTEQFIYEGQYTCQSTPNFNEIALTDLATTLGGTWGDSYDSRWSDWTKKAGKNADLSDDDTGADNNYAMSNLSSGGTVSVDSWFTYTRNRGSSTLTVVAGFGLGEKGYNSTMTINSPMKGAIVEFSYGKNTPTVYFVTMTAEDEAAGTWTRSMTLANALRYCKYYESVILAAIADCKAYETSSAFATYIEGKYDAGELKTAAEVYAAHSAWQVAQAQANGSTDYSKAIMNRTFELHNTNGWTITGDAATGGSDSDNNGVVEYGEGWSQYYTGWNGRNVSQNIASLPAGSYRLTAKVYSWSGGAPVRLFANGQLSDAENGDDHDPVLDFTVTGNEASIKIGIGGTGNNNDTDNTWGTWGYRVKNFTLTRTGVSGTIPSSGYGSLASAYGLDFANATGLTAAYVVSSITPEYARLTAVDELPANTGMILKGTPSATYSIPVKADAAFAGTNYLQAAVTATDIAANEAYILQSGEFHLVTAASTIPAGKAYLLADDVPANAHALSFSFEDDETTGIKSMHNAEFIMHNNEVYNLNGQRVDKPAKGLYIKNGKKVVLK